MDEYEDGLPFKERITNLVNEGKIDEAVQDIGKYLKLSSEELYLDHLEEVIETVSALHGGQTVIRFLIENQIIDFPSLLKDLSKQDQLLRYSFLFLLKTMCENESDLFLPFSEELLNSDDPNVREADLQLLIFISGGDNKIEDEALITTILNKLIDEKDFVVEKAGQALKAIGKKSPHLMTKLIKNFVELYPDNDDLKNLADEILKASVSVETVKSIKEIPEEDIEDEDKKEEDESSDDIDVKDIEPEEIEKKEAEIIDKEKELKVKELELKEKQIELEEKELEEKEKALKIKEELIEKESRLSELSQVEIELKEKEIEDMEEKIREQEVKRIEEALDERENKEN